MKIKNIVAAVCGVIVIACMATGLPVSAAEVDETLYADIDGDGTINQAEMDYAAALQAMLDFQARYDARAAAGIYSDELLVPEDALGNEALLSTETESPAEEPVSPEETAPDATLAPAADAAETIEEALPAWDGTPLTKLRGSIYGPSGKEVYYNLNMTPVIELAQQRGVPGSFWVRDDGVKMYGDYIMVAASYELHPYGTLVETSLGTAIVLDTGGFAASNPNLIDIAVRW